ncbi:recombinase family protein, partial [Phaeobacter gallaeciensis]|uniref:recombinase family protein n=1 Tax=Phaeobacter gallaeciensis TaxID=60890 RepID=UPI00237F0FB9
RRLGGWMFTRRLRRLQISTNSETRPCPGFERLVAMLCSGSIGAVFCPEVSRLARNGRDWRHMLELCGLVDARVVDHDGVYDPRHPNDRLRSAHAHG